MKVSRRSWHYRIYRFWTNMWQEPLPFVIYSIKEGEFSWRDTNPPRNLCRYFWSIVFLSTLGVVALVFTGLLVSLLIVIGYPIYRLNQWMKARKAAKVENDPTYVPPPPKEPSLVASFIKARKQKVCPMIELVD